ncbi:hypothetical protein KAS50_03745 [bacterium]|nr:hypothetical protein [bacterium]
MEIDPNVNPQKSFQFVKLITNVVADKTQTESPKEFAKDIKASPKELSISAQKLTLNTQKRISPHERFINIVI